MISTQDEILDLVNEKDEVIGEVGKSKANSDPKLIHREIGVFIYDDLRRVLFNKRSQNKKVKPGWWTVVGGHIGKGEEPEMAAHRELVEEMGFDTNLKFVKKELKRDPNETHFVYVYVGMYEGQPINFNREEMDEVKFFDKQSITVAKNSGEKFGGDSVNSAREIWEREMGV